MMILMMVFTPIVLVVSDTFISLMVSAFTNDVGRPLSDADINNFETNFVGNAWASYYSTIQNGNIDIGGTNMTS
jgi:hypothetical protein